MTRKHFKLIADAIASQDSGNNTLPEEQMRREIARALAARLATQNPRFDRDTFLEACNV